MDTASDQRTVFFNTRAHPYHSYRLPLVANSYELPRFNRCFRETTEMQAARILCLNGLEHCVGLAKTERVAAIPG